VGYVQLVPSGWNFRVTDISGVTIGSYCLFGNAATATAAASYLAVTASSLSAATSSTLNYQANRGLTLPVVVVDSATPLATGIVVKSQFAFTTDVKLNGIIDVYQDRKKFFAPEETPPGGVPTPPNTLPPAAAFLHDTLNFSTTYGAPATFAGPTVTATGAVATVTGDFSWVDGSDTNTTCDAAEWTTATTGAIQGGSFADWAVDTTKTNCQQIVFNQVTPTAATTALTSFLNIPGTVVLNATDFTGNVEWSYGLTLTPATTGKTGQAWDPGAWTINGAQVYIQYMPYGTGLSRIVYAANRGLLNPSVTADITANGSTFSCALGTAPSKTVTSLAGAIDTCVAAKGISSGKVAILLTFIAPDQDIEVYSAYNAGGTDRGTVVNTSNGRSFFYGTGVTFP
jgi:hypothetical protein